MSKLSSMLLLACLLGPLSGFHASAQSTAATQASPDPTPLLIEDQHAPPSTGRQGVTTTPPRRTPLPKTSNVPASPSAPQRRPAVTTAATSATATRRPAAAPVNPLGTAPATAPLRSAVAPAPQPQGPIVYVTPKGECFHKSDCKYARSGKAVTLAEAQRNSRRPCTFCYGK